MTIQRDEVTRLTDLPNVGPATAGDLACLGIHEPHDLATQDPDDLFQKLYRVDGRSHDICTRDIFAAAIAFVNTGEARPWWEFSRERKGQA